MTAIEDKTPEEVDRMVGRILFGLTVVPPGETGTMLELIGQSQDEEAAAHLFADMVTALLPGESSEVVTAVMEEAMSRFEFISDSASTIETLTGTEQG